MFFARADVVHLHDREPLRNVRITDLRDGRLVFRGVSREFLRKPVDAVAAIEVDDLPGVGLAESAAADGDWPTAIAKYEQALAGATAPWLRDYLRFRLARACDRTGRFDAAVEHYLAVLASSAALAERCAPRNPGPPGGPANRAALQRLRDARPLASSPAARALFVQIALLEGGDVLRSIEDSAGGNSGVAAADGSPPAPPASQPGLGLLPPTSAPAATTPPANPGLRPAAPPLAPVVLPADSFLLDVIDRWLDAGEAQPADDLLRRALAYVPLRNRAPWRLRLARVRIERGEPAAAAADLMALAEPPTDPAVAAEALYHVGLAHERLGQPDVAEGVYRDVCGRAGCPAWLRARAEEALKRLTQPKPR